MGTWVLKTFQNDEIHAFDTHIIAALERKYRYGNKFYIKNNGIGQFVICIYI